MSLVDKYRKDPEGLAGHINQNAQKYESLQGEIRTLVGQKTSLEKAKLDTEAQFKNMSPEEEPQKWEDLRREYDQEDARLTEVNKLLAEKRTELEGMVKASQQNSSGQQVDEMPIGTSRKMNQDPKTALSDEDKKAAEEEAQRLIQSGIKPDELSGLGGNPTVRAGILVHEPPAATVSEQVALVNASQYRDLNGRTLSSENPQTGNAVGRARATSLQVKIQPRATGDEKEGREFDDE